MTKIEKYFLNNEIFTNNFFCSSDIIKNMGL